MKNKTNQAQSSSLPYGSASAQSTRNAAPKASEHSPEEVAVRAYYIFLNQGAQHGHDQENWFEAESAFKNEARSA